MIPPFPMGRYPFYPPYRQNATWTDFNDSVLIHESVKMTFMVFLLGFILIILCKECGICKGAWKCLSRYCRRNPETSPIVERRQDTHPDIMVNVSDVRERDESEIHIASGDFVSHV